MTKKTKIVCIAPLVIAEGKNEFEVLLEVVSDEPDAKQQGYRKVATMGFMNGDQRLRVEYGFNYPVGYEGVYNPLYLYIDVPIISSLNVNKEPKFEITKI